MQNKIEISPIPLMPEILKEAIKQKELVIFVGAGVSRLVGCKSWRSLAEDLLKICFDKSLINYKNLEELKKESDNKKLISIAHHILKRDDKEEIFFDELKKALAGDNTNQCEIYKYIADIGTFFVTTNADKKFHNTQNRNFFNIEKLKSKHCKENTLFHLHGCIDDKNSLVFTLKQYFLRYQNKNFQEFLNHIFNKYTVLFLGYGLSEFELLDFIMQRHNQGKKAGPKHYILLPYMKEQEVIASWHQHYYADMDINVIAYDYTEKGYEQLVDVLKEWSYKNPKFTLQINDLGTLLEKMPNLNKDEINNVLNFLQGEEYDKHFWQKIPKYPQQSIELFDELLNEGYFNIQNLPPRKENSNGSYSFVYWEKSDYLIAITQYLTTINDKERLMRIKTIIDDYIAIRSKTPNAPIDELFMRVLALLTPIEMIISQEQRGVYLPFIKNVIQTETCLSWATCSDYFNVICKIDDKALLGNFLEIVLQGRKVGTYRYVSCVEEYYVINFLEENSKIIIEKMNIFDIQKIISQIEKAEKEGCYIEHISLESNNNEDSFHDKYIQSILFFIRDVLLKKATKEEGLKILKRMLKSESQAIQRMAIFIIAKRYDDFNALFWEIKKNPFNLKYQPRMELYTLLVGNKAKLSTESFEIIANWIEKSSKLQEEEKKSWYKGFSDISELMKEKYDAHQIKFPNMECYSITPHYPKVEVREGYVSPYTVEELSDMKNSQIVKKINNFKAKHGWDEPTKEGLLSILQLAVIQYPSKFLDDWKILLSLEIGVLANIMSGFEIAGKDKKSLNWNALLDFYDAVTSDGRFMFPKNDSWTTEYQFIYYFVNLIKKACDKEYHFPKEFSNTIRDKLLILLDYAKNAKTTTQNFQEIDIQTLNSFQGNIFSALISISWLNKHVFECNEWDCLIKTKLTDILTTPTLYSAEFAFSFGQSYPCLLAFDSKWFEEYKPSIFITQDNPLWQSNFLGYLHSNHIRLEIYKYFEERGDYKKGLNELSSPYAKQKILEHILAVHVYEKKAYTTDSLLYKIIHRNETILLEHIISYFYRNYNEENVKDQDDLIKAIWKDILNLTPCDDAIKSDCLKFVSSISNLDDTSMELVKQSLVSKNREDFFFVKGLLLHTDHSLKQVGEIIEYGLTKDYIIQYHNDKISEIVKRLLKNDTTKDLAEAIRTLYLKKGYTFLQAI